LLVCFELHINAERVIDHHVQQCADVQLQCTQCDEPRSRNIERCASRLVSCELVVLADASSAANHRTDERPDAPDDDMGGVHTTARSFGSVLGHSAAEHQRSDTSDGQLLALVHSCAVDELGTDRRSNDRVQCDHKLGHQHDSSEQHGTCFAECLSITTILDGIMVLDLFRISSDLELESRQLIDHHDRVYATDRIESIDTIRRHSHAAIKRSIPSIDDVPALVLIGIATLNVAISWKWNNVRQCHEHKREDDLSVEFRISATERVSICIVCIRLMVLDLVRISSNHELESRIRIVVDHDRVHATDRIESIDTIHRYSRSVDQ